MNFSVMETRSKKRLGYIFGAIGIFWIAIGSILLYQGVKLEDDTGFYLGAAILTLGITGSIASMVGLRELEVNIQR